MSAGAQEARRARTYGGRTAEERQAERRARLLDTALALFGTEGFAPVGINRICTEAGVTARHFYEDFPTREELLLALYDAIMLDVLMRVGDAIATAPLTYADNTEAGLAAYVHAMLDDPRRARICCIEAFGASDVLRDRTQEIFALFADLILEQATRLQQAGAPINVERSNFVTMVLVGGTNQAMAAWLSDPSPPPIDVLIEELTRVYVAVGMMPSSTDWRAQRRAQPLAQGDGHSRVDDT